MDSDPHVPATSPARKISKSVPGHKPLTQKQKNFLRHYWATGSVTEAAKAAGYSQRPVWMINKRGAVHEHIRAELQRLSQAAEEGLLDRRGALVNELHSVAFAKITDVVDLTGGTVKLRPQDEIPAGVIQKIKETKHGLEITMYDKLRAIESLARISGLEVQHVDVTSGGAPVVPINVVFEVVPPRKAKDADCAVSNA